MVKKNIQAAFLLLSLALIAVLVAEPVLSEGIDPNVNQGSALEPSEQSPLCGFNLAERSGESTLSQAVPQFSEPRVVYADAGAVYLSQWLPMGSQLLVVKDTPGSNRQIVLTLNPFTGKKRFYGERNYSDSPPLWHQSTDAVVYLDWAYSKLSKGEVEYVLVESRGGIVPDPSPLVSGISAPVLAMGEDDKLFFYTKEFSQLVVFDGKQLREAEITSEFFQGEAPDHPAYTQSRYPAHADRVLPRPGTQQVLFFNQPRLLIASEEAGCVIDLGKVSTPEGEVPLWAFDARWSPDGRYLALLATSIYPGQASGRGTGFRSNELIVLDFHSHSMRRVPISSVNSSVLNTITDLAWDPGSELLAVLAVMEVDENGAEQQDLYLVNVGTGTAQFAVGGHDLGGGFWGTQLVWSPNGSHLIANCSTGHLGRLCLFDVSRRNSRSGFLSSREYEPTLSGSQTNSQVGYGEAVNQSFVPPQEIEVTMFRLNGSGARREPYTFCSPDDTAWGCTAFCSESAFSCPGGNHVFPYPYPSSTITVSVEKDYLMDVIPSEMGSWYDPAALASQAVAARTYAFFYQHYPPNSPFNNSIAFQAFIPRKFESQYPFQYPNDEDFQWDDPCGADYKELNYSQKRVCDAVLEGADYLSYLDESPIRAEFSSDVKGGTITWDKYPYLVGVLDPISTACDSNDFGHRRGMSQEGASRWGRGHQCSYNGAPTLEGNVPGLDWSVFWSDRNQILTHYYTGIHIRNENAQRLTPDLRWTPLAVDLRPSISFPLFEHSKSYSLDLLVQNSGASRWTTGDTGILLRWGQGDAAYDVVHPLSTPSAPGDVFMERLILDTQILPSPGETTLLIDFVQTMDKGWVPFSELEPGLPWYSFGPLKVNVVEKIFTAYFPVLEQ